jgi:hypothetical protein
MGELYERILGQHPSKPKISTDGLQACMRLIRSGQMTVNQADQMFADHYGGALGTSATGNNAGRTEATDLLNTIPTGSTTNNRLDRIERAALIEAVLVIADLRQPPFDTPAALRTVFGVPDRS